MRAMLLVIVAAVCVCSAMGRAGLRTTMTTARVLRDIEPLAKKYDCHVQKDNLKDTLAEILDKNDGRADDLEKRCDGDRSNEKAEFNKEKAAAELVQKNAVAQANETLANQTAAAQSEYDRVVGEAEASLAAAREAMDLALELKENATAEFEKAKSQAEADKDVVANEKKTAAIVRNESLAAVGRAEKSAQVEAKALWNATMEEAKEQRRAAKEVCQAEYDSTAELVKNDTHHVAALEKLYKKLKLCQEGRNEETTEASFIQIATGHPCAPHKDAIISFVEESKWQLGSLETATARAERRAKKLKDSTPQPPKPSPPPAPEPTKPEPKTPEEAKDQQDDDEDVKKPAKPMCCKALTANCLACAAGKSVAEFCKTTKRENVVGCKDAIKDDPESKPRACCRAMTPTCLACSAGKTVEDFCQGSKLSGCAKYNKNPGLAPLPIILPVATAIKPPKPVVMDGRPIKPPPKPVIVDGRPISPEKPEPIKPPPKPVVMDGRPISPEKPEPIKPPIKPVIMDGLPIKPVIMDGRPISPEKPEKPEKPSLPYCGEKSEFQTKKVYSSYLAKLHPVTVYTEGKTILVWKKTGDRYMCEGQAKGAWGVAQAKELECDAASPAEATATNMWTAMKKNTCYFKCQRCTDEAPAPPEEPEEIEPETKPVLFNSSNTTVDSKVVTGDLRDMRRRVSEAQEDADATFAACTGAAGGAFTLAADAATTAQTQAFKDAADVAAAAAQKASDAYEAKVEAGLEQVKAIDASVDDAMKAFNKVDEQTKETEDKLTNSQSALKEAQTSAADDKAEAGERAQSAFDASVKSSKNAFTKAMVAADLALKQALDVINKACSKNSDILKTERSSVEKMQSLMKGLKVAAGTVAAKDVAEKEASGSASGSASNEEAPEVDSKKKNCGKHKDGQRYKKDCNTCTCNDGREMCTKRACGVKTFAKDLVSTVSRKVEVNAKAMSKAKAKETTA